MVEQSTNSRRNDQPPGHAQVPGTEHPRPIFVQPVSGFQVDSVHSMAVLALMAASAGEIHKKGLATAGQEITCLRYDLQIGLCLAADVLQGRSIAVDRDHRAPAAGVYQDSCSFQPTEIVLALVFRWDVTPPEKVVDNTGAPVLLAVQHDVFDIWYGQTTLAHPRQSVFRELETVVQGGAPLV